ncbi:hypothetical protein B0H13DRAFT_2330259 [Mycena leptocephala]|nr:hypothetical protein B0H13DRAFT_2330259 [Mycena leptocephala]
MSLDAPTQRDIPPHLPSPAVNISSAPTAADTTAGGTGAFLTARSNSSAEEIDSRSGHGEDTTPINAPSSLRLQWRTGVDGIRFLVNPDTNLRFDVMEEEGVAPPDNSESAPRVGTYQHPNARVPTLGATSLPISQTSPSSTSDMNLTETVDSGPIPCPEPPSELALDSLFNELRVHLSPEQRSQYSLIRGMLSTGRSALLSTTSFVAGQRANLAENTAALEQKIKSSTRSSRTYASCAHSAPRRRNWRNSPVQLTRAMAMGAAPRSPRPEIPSPPRSDSRAATPLEEYQAELDTELPPRAPGESVEAYFRRGASTTSRKERTAAAFAPASNPALFARAPPPSAVHFAKNPRFNDVGSISTTRTPQYQNYTGSRLRPGGENVSASSFAQDSAFPAGSHYETFHQDQEKVIRQIAHREIGEVLNLPPHIRPVKTDPPPKYKGDDDLDVFMRFVELHCTWLRSQMLCGYDPSVDKYRMGILKTHLEGAALEWFIQTVNSPRYLMDKELTFTDAVGPTLALALRENHRLAEDIEHHIQHIEYRIISMIESQRLIHEELTRRLLEREAYVLDVARAAPSSTSYRAVVGTAEDVGEMAVPSASSTAISSESSIAIAPDSPGPPSVGSTPPPSYPGTPEAAASDVPK